MAHSYSLDLLLVGGLGVSRLVQLDRLGTTVVKEVDGDTGVAAAVRGEKAPIEVLEQVDFLTAHHAWGENTWHGNANIGLRVVSNDDSIDDKVEKRVLVLSGVLFEQCRGVVIANRGVGRPLSDGAGSDREEDSSLGQHCYRT